MDKNILEQYASLIAEREDLKKRIHATELQIEKLCGEIVADSVTLGKAREETSWQKGDQRYAVSGDHKETESAAAVPPEAEERGRHDLGHDRRSTGVYRRDRGQQDPEDLPVQVSGSADMGAGGNEDG